MKYRMVCLKWARSLDGNGISLACITSDHSDRDTAIRHAENAMMLLDGGWCLVIDDRAQVHLTWERPGSGKIHVPPLERSDRKGFTVFTISTGAMGATINETVPWAVLEGKI